MLTFLFPYVSFYNRRFFDTCISLKKKYFKIFPVLFVLILRLASSLMSHLNGSISVSALGSGSPFRVCVLFYSRLLNANISGLLLPARAAEAEAAARRPICPAFFS